MSPVPESLDPGVGVCVGGSIPSSPQEPAPPTKWEWPPDSMLVSCLHYTGLQAALSVLVQPVQRPLSAPPRVCAVLGHLSSHRTSAPDGVLHTDCPLLITPGLGLDLLLTQQPLGSPLPPSLGSVSGDRACCPPASSGHQKAWRQTAGDRPPPRLSLSLSPESHSYSHSSSCHTAATPPPMTAQRLAPLPHHPLHRSTCVPRCLNHC